MDWLVNREKALEWWHSLPLETQCLELNKTDKVLLNNERKPNTLSGREIEIIHQRKLNDYDNLD